MAMGFVIVDPQKDFMPGGNLAVTDGNQIVQPIIRAMKHFHNDMIFVTKDSHPKEHRSFASNNEGTNVLDVIEVNGIQQVMWPDHCVDDTDGQEIAQELQDALPPGVVVVHKGLDVGYDSYSGVKDAGGKRTGLVELMTAKGITSAMLVYVAGLATDYCVKATALDLAAEGYKVRVIIDGCRGVAEGTTEQALAEMDDAGIEFVKAEAMGVPVRPLE